MKEWIKSSQAPPIQPPRETAEPGDILLFAGAKGINLLIAWFGGTPYFHAAIYAGDDEIVEARPSGVARRNLTTKYGSHCIAVLPAPGGRDCGRKALAWAQTQIGAPYDPIDLLVIFLERVFRKWQINYTTKNKYSCGEFVARAWIEAGNPLLPQRDPDDTQPADIAKLLPDGVKPHVWSSGAACR